MHNSLRFACRNLKSVPLEKFTRSWSNKCTHTNRILFSMLFSLNDIFDVCFFVLSKFHVKLKYDSFSYMHKKFQTLQCTEILPSVASNCKQRKRKSMLIIKLISRRQFALQFACNTLENRLLPLHNGG